jgi:hypothetical protein
MRLVHTEEVGKMAAVSEIPTSPLQPRSRCAEDLPFPHVGQVYLIERHVTDLHGNPASAVAALGVADPAPGQVSAADLAWHAREQWAFESFH